MNSNGAVFFLGNRAHYQVLEQPNNSYTNSNQEMVNSNIPTIHGNNTTKQLSNYENSSYNETLVKPSTSTYPSPMLTHYNGETNNVVLNHSSNEAYYANKPDNFTHTEETQCYNKNGGCKEAIINIDDEIGFSLGNGVKHRSKKYGASNGSSEFILNDNDDLSNLNPSDLNGLDNDINKNKLPKRNRTFTASALLRALMARRRRRPEPIPPTPEPYVSLDYMTCTYRDSCRCLDCQSRYFECDDDDDDDDDEDFLAKYSVNEYNANHQEALSDESDDDGGSNSHHDGSNSHYDGSKRHYDGSNSHFGGSNSHFDGSNINGDGPSGQGDVASVSETAYRTSNDDSASECLDLEAGCYEDYLEDTDDEVFLKPTPTKADKASGSTDPLIQAPKPSNPQSSTTETEQEKLELELAAGAPVFFDHLLNHPFTCCIQ